MIEEDLIDNININIRNKDINIYLTDYLVNLNRINSIRKTVFNKFISMVKDINIFTWDTMCTNLKLLNGNFGIIFGFYSYLNDKGYNFGKYNHYIKENNWILDVKNYSGNLYFEGSKPENIYIMNDKSNRHNIYIYTDDDTIRNIIKGFLDDLSKKLVNGKEIREFVKGFEDSLSTFNIQEIRINSFNELTFDEQYKFYERKKLIHILKKFYQYLIKIRKKDVFSFNSGLNRYFLNKDNFFNLYSQGYRVVYFNKTDCIPQIDRWMLSPNGYEKYTTTLNATNFVVLDFSRVKSEEIKINLKKWAFYENKSMKTLKNSINNIFIYFEFIQQSSNINGKIMKFKNTNYNDAIIKKEEIILFLKQIKDKNYEQNTLNAYSFALASFINYLLREGYRIDPTILDFLRIKKPKALKGKVIEKSDFTKIFDKLAKDIKLGSFYQLRYIFMYLLATTNFRPNDILNLKRDCIVETMKKGEFKIVSKYNLEEKTKIIMTNKTSGGELVEINPSARTIELIKMAIDITKEIYREGDINLKEYIFIDKDNSGITKAISIDRMYRSFKEILKACDIDRSKYTLYDIRHTYMTTLFNECSIDVAMIASGHKDIDTTFRHYVHPEIRDYLEALHKIDIGNIKVKGNIIEKLEDEIAKKNIKSITVKGGCGYCNGNCIDNDRIDCLICKNFIVTLDRAPYLQNKVKEIDFEIKNEKKMHDKEHLISIKKLYLAYLAQIYTFIKENDNGER